MISTGVDFTFFSKDYAHKLNLYSSVQHTARQSYYGAGKDPKAYGKTNDLTAIAGIQYSYNFNRLLFMPAVLTTGSEYVYNKLADKMLGYHRSIDQKVDIYSFFLQNQEADWTKTVSSIISFSVLVSTYATIP